MPYSSFCVDGVLDVNIAAVMLGAQSIMLGVNDLVVTGGMESMSNTPFLLARRRSQKHLGDLRAVDSLVWDGLWDPHKDVHMGEIGEICAEEMGISRADQVPFFSLLLPGSEFSHLLQVASSSVKEMTPTFRLHHLIHPSRPGRARDPKLYASCFSTGHRGFSEGDHTCNNYRQERERSCRERRRRVL